MEKIKKNDPFGDFLDFPIKNQKECPTSNLELTLKINIHYFKRLCSYQNCSIRAVQIHNMGWFMRGKKIDMSKIRAVVQRLKNGQSIRQINEELKIHRTRVREVAHAATIHQWLNPDKPMPTDEEISIALGFEKKDKVHFLCAKKRT